MSLWWKSAADFWAMGGAGYFVWMSYGALLLAIVIELAGLALRRRRALAAIEEERELEAEN